MKTKGRTITIEGTVSFDNKDENTRLLAISIINQLEKAKTGNMSKDDFKALLAKIIQIGLREIFNDPDKMKELQDILPDKAT